MIISHRHRFIFFCNGKTGTTSIEQSLGHLNEGERYAFAAKGLFMQKHVPPVLLRACLPEETWRRYFKFVFVRNPFDWCVSQWSYNFRFKFLGLPDAHPARRAASGEKGAFPMPMVMGRSLGELAATQVFSAADVEFLFRYLKRTYRVVPYADGSYQVSFLQDAEGRQLVDFVGRFERLEQDYASIMERLGLDVGLPHLNRTAGRDYQTWYTAESAAAVVRLWAVDFRTLGYPTAANA
jgi:hypothetical protein